MASQSAVRSAIQEIRRGEQLMNQLHSHLQLHTTPATELSKGIQQAITGALAILRSRESKEANAARTQRKKRRPVVAAASDGQNERERDQKRRKPMNSRTIVTPAPYFDGHQWRKYGQKMIHNSKHPRHYYRCTHRNDQGCLATKLVQEEESDDSPMFRVIYTNQHTCNNTRILDFTPQIIFSSPQRKSNFIFESKESYSGLNNIESNQEQLNSLSLQNEDLSGEMCNSTLSDLKKEKKIEEDTSSTSMIKDFPLSPDAFHFDFDVDDILSLLS